MICLVLQKSLKTDQLVAVVAAVVVVAYFIFFNIISSTNKALAELDHELDAEVRVESELKDLNHVIAATVEEREVLDSYFVEADGVVDFINDLEGFVKYIGAVPEILLVDIKDEVIARGVSSFEYLNVEIVVEGTWEELFNFSELLDTMPLYLRVNKMQIENISNTGEGGGPSENWTSRFNIDVIKRK